MYKTHYLFLSLALLFFLFTGCKKERVPGNVLDLKKMALLLAEMHIAEGTFNESRTFYSSDNPQLAGYYKSILDKHGLSRQEFDRSLAWYTQHPKLYLKVYDQVIAILSEGEAGVVSEISKSEAIRDSLKAVESGVVDLWNGKKMYVFPSRDTTDHRVPFRVQIDSVTGGIYTLKAYYTFKKEDISSKNNMCLITCYADSTRDSVLVDVKKTFSKRAFNATLEAHAKNPVVAIEGFLLLNHSKNKPHVKIESVQLQFVPLEDQVSN